MRTVFSFVVATAGLLALNAPAVAQQRIAFIDSRRVVQEAPGAQEVRESIEREMAQYEGQLTVMRDSLAAMVTDYQQQSVTMSPDAKTQREDEIRQKQTGFEQRAAQLEEQAGARQNELMEPVMRRVNDVINTFREEGGYAIIFDSAQGIMVSADPALDVTEQIITMLREAGPTASNPQ